MKFEIIKNSESSTGYDIPDDTFHGQIPGLAMGWQFEVRNVRNKNYDIGHVDYYSVTFSHLMPEDFVEKDGYEEYVANNGWELTGRVIFRGYYEEEWDFENYEWYYDEVSEEDALKVLNVKHFFSKKSHLEIARNRERVVERE